MNKLTISPSVVTRVKMLLNNHSMKQVRNITDYSLTIINQIKKGQYDSDPAPKVKEKKGMFTWGKYKDGVL